MPGNQSLPGDFVAVECFDGNEPVHSMRLTAPDRVIETSSGRRYEANYIGINLESIPLAMLDSIDRMNFRKKK